LYSFRVQSLCGEARDWWRRSLLDGLMREAVRRETNN